MNWGVEVIRGYKKRYTGIRDPHDFLGCDCVSHGSNKGFYLQELNAISIDLNTNLAGFN